MTSRATIDATIALLRALLTGRQPLEFPATVDWEQTVAFASAQLVLPALHPALGACGLPVPEDAAEFFTAIHAANIVRNAEMRKSIAQISCALNSIGIAPVLLKGASVLAAADAPSSAWRFLSDLDLLVPEHRLAEAVAAVRALGFSSRHDDYDADRDAHYPALIAPGGRFALELHTRIFAERLLPLLETRLPAGAQPLEVDGAHCRLPALADRIAHLIAHAQLHHGHYRQGRLLLRGYLELSMLAGAGADNDLWTAVLAVFARPGPATAYLAAWRRLLAPQAPLPAIGRRDEIWAKRAITQLSRPPMARALRAILSAGTANVSRALRNRAVMSRHLATLASAQALRARIARQRERMRQAYWA